MVLGLFRDRPEGLSSLILRERTAGSVVLSGHQWGGGRTGLHCGPLLVFMGTPTEACTGQAHSLRAKLPFSVCHVLDSLGEGAWPTARWDVEARRRLWPGRAGWLPRAVPGEHCHPRKPHVLWLFQNPGDREQHTQVHERGPAPAHAVKAGGQAATAAELGVRAGGHSTAALPHVPHTNH